MSAELVQGSEEWFAARCGKVTASRVADVLAQGRSGSPSTTRAAYIGELIVESLTGRPCNNFKGNADTERGTLLEPEAKLAYEILTGESVRPCGLIQHPRMERFAASPDGLIGDKGGIEIKCPRPHVHIEYLLAGKPPAAYLPQMASQAACAEFEWIDFVSYCPLMPEPLQLFVVRYSPQMEYIKEIESAVTAFLEELDSKLRRLKQVA